VDDASEKRPQPERKLAVASNDTPLRIVDRDAAPEPRTTTTAALLPLEGSGSAGLKLREEFSRSGCDPSADLIEIRVGRARRDIP
jgi:hypothetical protein